MKLKKIILSLLILLLPSIYIVGLVSGPEITFADSHNVDVVIDDDPPDSVNPDEVEANAQEQAEKEAEFNEAECNFSGVLNWAICPFLRGVDKVIFDWLINDERIEELFEINFETGEGVDGDIKGNMEEMWRNVRNLTNAIFIILFVIAIFGHVTGAIEAYTAKKIIPRIVIAAILTQLSWFISVELSAIFDDFGKGIGDLLEEALEVQDVELPDILFSQSSGDAKTTTSIFFGLAASIVIVQASIAIWLLLPFAVAVLVSILITIFTLLFRKIALIMLVIVSPLAMTMWALPSTEKWARKWFSWYSRLLVMFPFIVSTIVVGKAVAKVLSGVGQSQEDGESDRNWVFTIAALLTWVAPYALLPLTLKLAISTISNLTGVLDNAGKSLTGRAKNFAQGQRDGLKAEKRKDNLEKYASADKLKLRNLKTRKGRKDIRRRIKGRAFGGAFLPTRYNSQIRDDLVDQAYQERAKRGEIEHNRRATETAAAKARASAPDATEADKRDWEEMQNRVVIENVKAEAVRLGGAENLSEQEQELLRFVEKNGASKVLTNIGARFDGPQSGAELARAVIEDTLKRDGLSEDEIKEREDRIYGDIDSDDGVTIAENARIMAASIGDNIRLANGEKATVTAAMQAAAAGNSIQVHGNSDKAINSVRRFVRSGRYEKDVAAQRAVKLFVDGNVGDLMKQSPQDLLGYGGAIDSGFDKVVQYSEGSIKDIAHNSNDAEFQRLMNAFIDASANPSANANHSAVNGKTMLEAARKRYGETDARVKDFEKIFVGESGVFQPYNIAAGTAKDIRR